jgi:hypothetical protein
MFLNWAKQASEEVIKKVLSRFYTNQKRKAPNKINLDQFVDYLPIYQIDEEITEKLDALLTIAEQAEKELLS